MSFDHHRSSRGKHHGKGRPRFDNKPSPRPDSSSSVGKTVEGVLQRKGKNGYVLSEQPGETDVLVQGASLRLAMDGDRVRVRLKHAPPGERRSGDIIEVLNRSRQNFVGLFRRAQGVVAL